MESLFRVSPQPPLHTVPICYLDMFYKLAWALAWIGMAQHAYPFTAPSATASRPSPVARSQSPPSSACGPIPAPLARTETCLTKWAIDREGPRQ